MTKSNYSSLADGMPFTKVTSPYTQTGLTNGKPYYFVVTAVNGYGESGESSQVSATPQAVPAVTPGKLNDTGITASQCYQAGSDVIVDCGSTGAIALNSAQDGMTGRDANVATNSNSDGKLGFSFTSITGGCVQDTVTGLVWEGKTTDGGLRDWTKTYSNYSATYDPNLQYGTSTDASGFVTAVNATNLCGYNDWRLPTADELQSIVDYSVAGPGPTVDTTWFPNTQNYSFYWTASPSVVDPLDAWIVNFNNGYVQHAYRRSSIRYVRLVRGGQSPILPHYTVSVDGQEVTDNQTGLIWRRCAEGMNWDGATCAGVASRINHVGAMQLAATQASSTGIAWRLPNVKELSSITDKSIINPAIDSTAFPATPAYWFWSASPSVGATSFAWGVHFNDGIVDFVASSRGSPLNVRLVREGTKATISQTNASTSVTADGLNCGSTYPCNVAYTASESGILNSLNFQGQTDSGSFFVVTIFNETKCAAESLGSLCNKYRWEFAPNNYVIGITEGIGSMHSYTVTSSHLHNFYGNSDTINIASGDTFTVLIFPYSNFFPCSAISCYHTGTLLSDSSGISARWFLSAYVSSP